MPSYDFKNDPTYKAKREPGIIMVPKMRFLTLEGEGAPDALSEEQTGFQKGIAWLYGLAYGVKFWDKKHQAPPGYAPFTLAPIEALWWTASGKDFNLNDPSDWYWKQLLRVPEFVDEAFLKAVADEIAAKKKDEGFHQPALVDFEEGDCVQILHVGPYSAEQPTIDAMHAYAKDQGYVLRGKHHELYFGDPRRTDPEKLKTVLRQPVEKAA